MIKLKGQMYACIWPFLFIRVFFKATYNVKVVVTIPYKDKEKRKKYSREWIHKRRVSFFAAKVCLDCAGKDKLELHHLDPMQKESHLIRSWSKKRRDAEIAKCVVLCCECHQQRHGKYTAMELLDKLKDFCLKQGKSPTCSQADDRQNRLPGTRTYRRHFGTWNKALKAAGLPIRKSRNTKYA